MRLHTLTGPVASLAIPILVTACMNSPEVSKQQLADSTSMRSEPVSMSIALQGHLKQYVLTQRTMFYSDFTYDSKGRQATVWTYNQRSGEGKDETPQTVFTYDDQNRLVKVEEGDFSVNSSTGALVASSIIRRCELSYNGLTVTAKATLLPASTGNNVETLYDLDKAGHIIKQTQRFADGTKNEKVYLYLNDNVVQQDMTVTNGAGAITSRTRDKYEYDSSPNPLRGLISQGGLVNVQTYLSKNNVVKVVSENLSTTDASVVLSSTGSTYQYSFTNGGLPASYQAGTIQGLFVYDQ